MCTFYSNTPFEEFPGAKEVEDREENCAFAAYKSIVVKIERNSLIESKRFTVSSLLRTISFS
jgi:hypothetical protein